MIAHSVRLSISLIVISMILACGSTGSQSAQQAASPNNDTSAHASIDAAPQVFRTLPDADSAVLAVTSGYNEMGFRLLKSLAGNIQQNIFLSPLSAGIALSMVSNGARGQTAAEIATLLGTTNLSLEQINVSNLKLARLLNYEDSTLVISSANGIWMRNSMAFKAPFLERVKAAYRARLARADFADPSTRDEINGWVTDQTRGKIANLIEKIADSAAMYLINTLYFKGTWEKQFPIEATRPDTFTLLSGSPNQVQMMRQSGMFSYYEDSLVKIIKLPYLTTQMRNAPDGRLFMYVVVPDVSRKFTEFIQSVSEERWKEWSQAVGLQEGTIMLPRFTLDYKQELNEPLKQLGLRLAFSGWEADFKDLWEQVHAGDEVRRSGMDSNLFISKVLQKTYVAVDEIGTEAAAATSVEMAVITTAILEKPKPFEMIVDHPFICAIVDDLTGAMLFLGAIVEPTQ